MVMGTFATSFADERHHITCLLHVDLQHTCTIANGNIVGDKRHEAREKGAENVAPPPSGLSLYNPAEGGWATLESKTASCSRLAQVVVSAMASDYSLCART
jgi:hypothetical protein